MRQELLQRIDVIIRSLQTAEARADEYARTSQHRDRQMAAAAHMRVTCDLAARDMRTLRRLLGDGVES